MWIHIDKPGLKRWKPPCVDEWVDVTDNQTARVSGDTGETLIEEYQIVSEI